MSGNTMKYARQQATTFLRHHYLDRDIKMATLAERHKVLGFFIGELQ